MADGSGSHRDEYDESDGLLDIVDNPTFHTALVNKGFVFYQHVKLYTFKKLPMQTHIANRILLIWVVSTAGIQYLLESIWISVLFIQVSPDAAF